MAPDQSGRFQQISLMHPPTQLIPSGAEKPYQMVPPRRACSICGRAQNQRARRLATQSIITNHYGNIFQSTGILSEIGTKLRDWAVWQARAGCYSQAALSSN